jgi:hypothetical protein
MMNKAYRNTSILPNPQKIEKTVVKLKEVYQQFDTLNFILEFRLKNTFSRKFLASKS